MMIQRDSMLEKEWHSKNGMIRYWIGGKSEETCMVFVHGMLADHTIFSEQIKFFRKHYKIVVIDVPLHGKSRFYENFTFHGTAQELHAILEKENVKKAVLIGQSMGGYICQEFGILYPEKVEALIAVDSHPFGHVYYKKWEQFIFTRIGKWSSCLPSKWLATIIARNANDTLAAYRKTLQVIATYNKNEMVQTMNHVLQLFFQRKEPVSFDFPVLLVVGEKEITGFIKKYNVAWARREGYPLATIRSAAHNANMDNAHEFNAVTQAFLQMIEKN